MSGERAFSFSWSASATMGAGAGAGAGAGIGTGARTEAGVGTGAGAESGALGSKTALRIFCKSSLEYLRILVAARVLAMGSFGPEGLAGWLDNLSPDLGDREESRGATKGATEGVTEGRLRRGRPRPWTKVILELISFKTLF